MLVPPYGADVMVGAGLGRNCDDRTVMGHTATRLGKLLIRSAQQARPASAIRRTCRSKRTISKMGNPIIGSRQITDTNSGPVTFNRPDQTHNPMMPVRRRLSDALGGRVMSYALVR